MSRGEICLTPINGAEAILEPFWDPKLSGLDQWDVDKGQGYGVKVKQFWCWVGFEWTRRAAEGPVLRLRRRFGIGCAQYDRLMVSLKIPETARVRIAAATERGERVYEGTGRQREHFLELGGAGFLESVALEIIPGEEGSGAGWFNWVGLQNSRLLGYYLDRWRHFDPRWEKWLQAEDHIPTFSPMYGIVIDMEGVERLRGRHAEAGAESPFRRTAERAQEWSPESQIGEFLAQVCASRYAREREEDRRLLGPGRSAALAGLVMEDASLLRLAARYALSLAAVPVWDSGFLCNFPVSAFEHRSFSQASCAEEVACILDLAGEMFTDAGRDLALRRIAESGIGQINYVAWKHEYIHHCNQLAAFSGGRLLGYTVMERTMPRVRPYTELAFQDLVDSLGEIVLPDGGFVEGPTYFLYTVGQGGLGLYYYARARGLDLVECVPETLKGTAAFAAVLGSTDPEADVIPICDASPTYEPEPMALLAAALPDSAWVTMFRKNMERTGRFSTSPIIQSLDPQIPEAGPEPEPLVALPEMGIAASTRKLGDALVKLLVMGNRAGAGHTHEDKGSFVLEFAGESFALDPGTCDYGHPLAGLLKHCERHNMLVPYGTEERPAPESPLPVDVKPVVEGDGTGFHARIDATAGWGPFYEKWVRTWESPSPDLLVIRDAYALRQGDGVEFYWNTRLPVRVEGRGVVISGKRGTVTLEIPEDCAVRVDELPMFAGDAQKRVAIRRRGRSGTLEMRARLAPGV